LLVTPGAYPRRKHLKVAPIGLALALPSNSKTWLERVSKENSSSIFGLFISDEEKKSYITLTSGCIQVSNKTAGVSCILFNLTLRL
jgi:hypothetical protein